MELKYKFIFLIFIILVSSNVFAMDWSGRFDNDGWAWEICDQAYLTNGSSNVRLSSYNDFIADLPGKNMAAYNIFVCGINSDDQITLAEPTESGCGVNNNISQNRIIELYHKQSTFSNPVDMKPHKIGIYEFLGWAQGAEYIPESFKLNAVEFLITDIGNGDADGKTIIPLITTGDMRFPGAMYVPSETCALNLQDFAPAEGIDTNILIQTSNTEQGEGEGEYSGDDSFIFEKPSDSTVRTNLYNISNLKVALKTNDGSNNLTFSNVNEIKITPFIDSQYPQAVIMAASTGGGLNKIIIDSMETLWVKSGALLASSVEGSNGAFTASNIRLYNSYASFDEGINAENTRFFSGATNGGITNRGVCNSYLNELEGKQIDIASGALVCAVSNINLTGNGASEGLELTENSVLTSNNGLTVSGTKIKLEKSAIVSKNGIEINTDNYNLAGTSQTNESALVDIGTGAITINGAGTNTIKFSRIVTKSGDITINMPVGQRQELVYQGNTLVAGKTNLSMESIADIFNDTYLPTDTYYNTFDLNGCLTITGAAAYQNNFYSTQTSASNFKSQYKDHGQDPPPTDLFNFNGAVVDTGGCQEETQTCDAPNECKTSAECTAEGGTSGDQLNCTSPEICCIPGAPPAETHCEEYWLGHATCIGLGPCPDGTIYAGATDPFGESYCGVGEQCCYDPSGEGTGSGEPVDTIVKITGFITDSEGIPIDETGNPIEQVGITITKGDGDTPEGCNLSFTVDVSNGMFSKNITQCRLVPNDPHYANINVGGTVISVPFNA